ncbi:MAG: T9SS type A sorting domain-containing protein [Bacteroidaceae bacterium]|nr:T9SS type A sorting domain-containing protein [Bacteroidaceae bacterium]
MRTHILSLFFFFIATAINAQLIVDSLGHVGIGTDNSTSPLSIGGGNQNSMMYLKTSDKTNGIYSENKCDCDIHSNTYAGFFYAKNDTGNAYGIQGKAVGIKNAEVFPRMIGVSGLAGDSYTAIGVFGGKTILSDPITKFAGIFGSESGQSPSFYYSGTYAGYFQGKVRVTNGIYATVLSPTTSASSSQSKNGHNDAPVILSDNNEKVTEKLNTVRTLQLLRHNPTKKISSRRTSFTEFDEVDTEKSYPEAIEVLEEDNNSEEPESDLSAIQYGLDAEQLKAVYPELVYEDKYGNVSINYVEMIPLLVKSINELSKELAELKGTNKKRAKAQLEASGIDNNVTDVDMVRMDQNRPNPFSESTVIGLNIPEKTQKAYIYIYDLSGKQIKNVQVSERGGTNITIYASELGAGMYIYTLVIDGKVIVTRRMIVEK